MTGGDKTIVKICIKCKRILPKNSSVCPDCKGTTFELVNLARRSS